MKKDFQYIDSIKRENTKGPSKITLKNYASDTRKFIRWYEQTYARPFPPKVITKETADAYLNPIYDSSPRSAKRYASSLRKFFDYLLSEHIITYNPLVINKVKPQNIDLWHLKEFDNWLFNLKKNPITIKNYMSDIRQFTHWIEATTLHNDINSSSTQIDPFAKINPVLIEIYKNRLLDEAKLSPSTVNRKLSSLRQFLTWAIDTKLLTAKNDLLRSISSIQKMRDSEPKNETADKNTVYPLQALQADNIQNQANENTNHFKKYSSFPPLRLMQKTLKGFQSLFDIIFVLSAIKLVENLKFGLWTLTGKEIFAPVPEVMKSLEIKENSITDGLPITELYSGLQTNHGLDRFIRTNEQEKLKSIRSLPKSVYAPFKISTRALPFWKKLKYHLRHTRPSWYRKYHSYPLVHYVHLGIALIIAVILGLRIYQPFLATNPSSAVLADSIGPTREISFRGHLKDNDGLPLTNRQNIRFAIYNSKTASRSALLWQETQDIYPDPEGEFSVSLGKNASIKEEIFSQNPALYLGISIGSNPELKPREELANYFLSANSQSLQGLKPITGNNAGTENVILALDSSGNLTIGGDASPVFQATGGNFSLTGVELNLFTNPGSNGNIVLNPDGTGIIDIRKPLQNTSEDITASTSAALQIADNLDINATSSAIPALQINQNGSGDIISGRIGGIDKFTVSNSGTVTIGEDLKILGNNISTVTGTFNIANSTTKHIYIGGEAEEIFLGGTKGTTKINHNLTVDGIIKANNGITLANFTKGVIPFIGNDGKIASDSASLFFDQTNKRLGLGTNSPTNKLTVVDNIALTGRAAGVITNTSTTDSANNVALRLNLGVDNNGTQARFATFYAKCQTVTCAGSAKGNIAVTTSGVAYNSGSADFAEYFKKAYPGEEFFEGDPVCFSKKEGVEKCTSDSNGLLGVYSKDAGFVGASNFENNPEYVLVGLIGQLKVKASNENGEIKSGDPIAVANSGFGVKATKSGQIVGRALESLDHTKSNSKTIKIALNVSWYDPTAILMNDGSLATAYESPFTNKVLDTSYNLDTLTFQTVLSVQNFLDTLNAGVLKIKNITVDSLTITTENVTIGTLSLKDYITDLVNEVLDERFAAIADNKNKTEENNKEIVFINPLVQQDNNASLSAKLNIEIPNPTPTLIPSPRPLAPDQTASLSATTINITNIYNNISSPSATEASESANPSPIATAEAGLSASISATPAPINDKNNSNESPELAIDTDDKLDALDTLNKAEIATFSAELAYVPNLTASLGRFDNGLISLGPTSLTDLTISSQISVGSNLKISSTSIDAIGTDLNLQPRRQGNLIFMAGLVTIDTKGNLSVSGNAEFDKDVNIKGKLATGIISPLAGSNFISITGDVIASGSGKFKNIKTESINIVRGVQADTSFTETVASGSAGTAAISTNELERTVVTPFVNDKSLIYIAPISDTKGIVPYIARQTAENPLSNTKGSFTIQIPAPQPFDIKFNWIIVN